jgi:hypothetical protein
MKRYYLLILLLTCTLFSFAQSQSVIFNIAPNSSISSESIAEDGMLNGIRFTTGDMLSIIINKPPNKNVSLLIGRGSQRVEFTNNDISANNTITTDSFLVFRKGNDSVNANNATIKITITVGNDATAFSLTTTVRPRQGAPAATVYRPGIAYYDARALGTDNALIKADFIKIAQAYFDPGISDYSQAIAAFNTNPFLKEISWDTTKVRANPAGSQSSRIFDGVFSTVGNIGGLDVTNIANGIAQFMIKRAKEELTITFFNRFKDFVEKNEEFKVLFPKTTDNLANLLAYKYPDMLPALRTGFFEDLKSITYHLDDVLELPRYQRLLRNFPEIRVAIRSIRLVHEIEAGDSDAATVIEKFAAFKEWKDSTSSRGFKNFGNAVQLGSAFSHSLRNDTAVSKDTTRAWITFREMDTLVSNEKIFRIYTGLVYQLVKKAGIRFYPDPATVRFFHVILEGQKENLFLFQNKVKEFIELANKADRTLDTLKNKKKKDIALTNSDYYAYIDVSLDVIDYGFSIAGLFDENIKADEYIKIARNSNELYRNIYKTEYTQAISNAMDILTGIKDMVNSSKDLLMPELLKIHPGDSVYVKSFEKLTAGDIAIINRRLSGTVDSLTRVLLNKVISWYEQGGRFGKLGDIITKLTRYGLFIANLADAKTPDEVEAILDNAVLPVGSSSIKKNSRFNLAIQSYLGAFYRASDLKQENNNAWNSRWGVTAPIGVAASWGLKGRLGSFSLFGSLLDLGAIVDYQLKKDSVAIPSGGSEEVIEKDYKIRLGQIFSPGVYAIYGFGGNIPLSFGLGAQYGPGLGKIETSGNLIENNPQWKFNIFLAVDIPFFNLVNTPKRYKPKH